MSSQPPSTLPGVALSHDNPQWSADVVTLTSASGSAEVDTLQPSASDREASALPPLVLTILGHPDPARIGAYATFAGDIEFFSISRLEPTFRQPEGDWLPLGHPSISRQPMRVVPQRGELRILRHDSGSQLMIDGVAVACERVLDRTALKPGIVLQIGAHVTLLLHDRPPAGVPLGGAMGMVGVSAAMGELRQKLRRAAAHDVAVLLQGESGTGKELAARALHDLSRRHDKRFVPVNMAAIPVTMLAAQLFGFVRGAFTGATTDHAGYFVQADQGTLFLDEMGEVAAEVQAGLLRALESQEVQRVGEERVRKVNVRVIAASDRNLADEVVAGRLRNPLLYRLAGYWVALPPLRDRVEDLPLLLHYFLAQQAQADSQPSPFVRGDQALLPAAIWPLLVRHPWPGNIRELRNLAHSLWIDGLDRPPAEIVRAVKHLLGKTQSTQTAAVVADSTERAARPVSAPQVVPAQPLELLDHDEVLQALQECRWVVSTAAQRLSCSRQYIYRLIGSGALGLRLLEDISSPEIVEAMQASQSLDDLAYRVLRVSADQLRRRIAGDTELQRAYRVMQRDRWGALPPG